MPNDNIIITTIDDLKKAFHEWHQEMEVEKVYSESEEKTFSINQVRLKLGRSHDTVKKMIRNGTLRATSDHKRVPEAALNKYLQNKSNKL